MNTLPPWADAQLSAEISDIQATGEGQRVEFKRELDDTDEVRREIAAFATAGGGRLFVGIADDGKLSGIAIDDTKARDQLLHRLDGIARGVKPAVKFKTVFAVADQQAIACVLVECKQDHPVFYSNQKPYIRDGRSSRPAEPDEVQRQVWSHPSAEQQRELERSKLDWMQALQREGAEARKQARQRSDALSRLIIEGKQPPPA